MGCVVDDAPLSLNGGCIADNIIPNYLRPSAGSCHDICKYGRRRASDDSSADAKKPNKPSPDAKSFSPRPKNHSNKNKLGAVVSLPANKQAISSVGQKTMKPSASVRPKPVVVKLPVSSDGVHGKKRRNDDVLSGRNTGASMPFVKKAWLPVGAPLSPKGKKAAGVVELKDRRMVKRVKTNSSNALESIPTPPSSSSPFHEEEEEEAPEIKCSGNAEEESEIKIPNMEDEFECEPVTDAPSTSSHDEVVSDTAVYQRKRNHYKRQRRSRVVVRPGDKYCSRPVRMKFQMANQMQLHKEDGTPTRHKLRRTRSKEDVSGCVSDSAGIGPLKASRSRDKYGSKASKSRCRRVRYGKTRVLVLDNIKGDLKRKYDRDDGAGAALLSRRHNLKRKEQVQRRKDVKYLFSYVVEETVSKLAERRKGMVKSLVGAFESLISLQTRSCFMRAAT